jgi:hypothetical protein
MSPIADHTGASLTRRDRSTPESRVFRAMLAVVIATVIVALITAPWRVTAGLLVGGSLSLLNYHWLRTSMAAVFASAAGDVPPRIGAIRYLLRYLVIATVVVVAYWLEIISFTATIAGLCSFVPAFFFEASRQSYFAIIGREESV